MSEADIAKTDHDDDGIPLPEWILSSFQKIQQQRLGNTAQHHSSVVSHNDFLMPALRLATSLADQLCVLQDETEDGQLLLPTPGLDWIHNVFVYNSRKNWEDDGSLFGAGANSGEVGDDKNIRGEILPLLLDKTTEEEARITEQQRIYSLGLVIYEIFSGGERPVEIERQQQEEGEQQVELWGIQFNEVPDEVNLLGGVINNVDNDNDHDQDEFNLLGETSFDGIIQQDRKSPSKKPMRNMYAVSIEPLRAKGLPRSVCDLVASMMNCHTESNLSGEEAYRSMSEVRDDLQLLVGKPTIYLYDQDMGKLSTNGLQFGDMFGRNAELSTIKDAYRRSFSGESELVTIFGQSGTGKSLLAYEFGDYVVSGGGIFMYGKFDQLRQGKPFNALASALNNCCGMLLRSNALLTQQLIKGVNSVLGREAYHLAKLIPNLSFILGIDVTNHVNQDEDDCSNGQKRLQYLLCQFVQVLSSVFGSSVVLFLDDLQWADSASIEAVNQLLLTDSLSSINTHFFFLGCYREGEDKNCNPLWKEICSGHARSTNIKLDYMDEETVNVVISESLQLFPRLTRTLSSVIYRKTKGHPLFIAKLLRSLSKDGPLRPSLIQRRWEWDIEKIESQKLPENVAMFLTNSIGALSEDVKSSLSIMSCFGASVEKPFVLVLERALNKSLISNFDTAVDEGLLDKVDDQYRFSHDRIQEAAYNMILEEERCLFHYKYGMALVSPSIKNVDDDILFIAVNQLNLGGPAAVQDMSQTANVASLNLRAGKKAMEMSDFEAAYSYFDHGITFLPKKHWEEYYSLSLELFDLAAKCALTKGDFDSLTVLTEEVTTKTHDFKDKLNVMYLSVCALSISFRLPEAVRKGLHILSKLDIGLHLEKVNPEASAKVTKDLLAAHPGDELLNYRRMTDPPMIMAMKVLVKVALGMNQMSPEAVLPIVEKMIQLSLSHGLSPVTPIGLAYFGSYTAKIGHIEEGYRYVKFSLTLLQKMGSIENLGEIYGMATQIKCFVEPVQAVCEHPHFNNAYIAAMTSGDVLVAMAQIHLNTYLRYNAGVNLQTIAETCASNQKMMAERNQMLFLVMDRQIQTSVLKLMGEDEDMTFLPVEQHILGLGSNESISRVTYNYKAFDSFMFRCYDDVKFYIEKVYACRDNSWATLFYAHSGEAFSVGLINFWLARKEKKKQQQWFMRGSESKLALKRWTQSCQWTFEAKWYLLEAEEAFCNHDYETAKPFYEKAMLSAYQHKFVNDEALACELAANFYLHLKENDKAVHHFSLAYQCYHDWGAYGKCKSLSDYVESHLNRKLDTNVRRGESTDSSAPSLQQSNLLQTSEELGKRRANN